MPPTQALTAITTKLNLVRAALVDFIEQATGYTCIVADRSNARPRPPYVVFEPVGGLQRIGNINDEQRKAGTNQSGQLITKHVAQRSLTVNIQAIGVQGARLADKVRGTDILEAVNMALGNAQHVAGLNDIGVAVRDKTPVSGITSVLEADSEPRATMDVVLGITIVQEYVTDAAATASFDLNNQ